MTQFTTKSPEKSTSMQNFTFTIPRLKEIVSIKTNTGKAEILSVVGDQVTVKLSAGSYTRRVQTGGSYIPSDTRTVSVTKWGTRYTTCDGGSLKYSLPSTYAYNEQGYTGTLPTTSNTTSGEVSYTDCPVGSAVSQSTSIDVKREYSGPVTKPAEDTRTYAYYYQYDIIVEYVGNTAPSLILTAPEDAQTLYENTAYTISGNATDADNGNIVNIRYSINDGTARALATGISDGTTAIPFAKTLIFRNGKLFDGATAITDSLAEGTAHMLRVWATDDQGATSTIISRSFYAVPNRAPSLTVDAPQPSGTINSDKFSVTGTCSDIDGNEVTVAYRINSANPVQVYKGQGGAWSFDVSLSTLQVGANSIVIEVTDSYNFKATKTVRLNKNEIKTPVNIATARYKLTPPKGSATGVLLWVRRTETLQLDAKISMVLAGEQEQYFAPTDEVTTAQVSQGIVEDEFIFETAEAKTNIVLKLEMTKTQENDAITLITGVFN